VPAPQKWWLVKGTDAAKTVISNFYELGFRLPQSDVHKIFESLSSRALASQSSAHASTQGIPLASQSATHASTQHVPSAPLPASQDVAASHRMPSPQQSQQQLQQQQQDTKLQQQQQQQASRHVHLGNMCTSRIPGADRQHLTQTSANDGPTWMPPALLPALVPLPAPEAPRPELQTLSSSQQHAQSPQTLPSSQQYSQSARETPWALSANLSASILGRASHLTRSKGESVPTHMPVHRAFSMNPTSACLQTSVPLSPPLPHFEVASGSSCSSLLPRALELQRWPTLQRSQADTVLDVIDIPDSPEPSAHTGSTPLESTKLPDEQAADRDTGPPSAAPEPSPHGSTDRQSAHPVAVAAQNTTNDGAAPNVLAEPDLGTSASITPSPEVALREPACASNSGGGSSSSSMVATAPVDTSNPAWTRSSSSLANSTDSSSTAQLGPSSVVANAADTGSSAELRPSSSVGEKRSMDALDQRATSEQAKSCQPECTICMDAVADTVFVPCGHLVSCGECAAKLKKKPCPVCRKKIKLAQKVFMS